MNSSFSPISDAIENNDIFSQHAIDVVHNFITSFSISHKIDILLINDKEFPRLIRNLVSILHNSQMTQEYPLPLQIVEFLTDLSQNPNLIEFISKELNIDLLMNTFFGNGSEKTIANYAKYLHFFALQATTSNMVFTKTETFEVIFSIIASAIHTKDLQYWSLVLISLLARNYTDFSAYMKTNHDFNQFKSDITELLSHENSAIAGAAFSAAMALSPVSEDFEYAIQASKKLLESNTKDEMFLYVVSLAIQDIEQKNGVGNDCFCALFIALLHANGLNAYESSKVLCSMKSSYAASLTPSEIRAFIVYLIQIKESFVSMSCCALLYFLVDAIPDIFVTLENPFELFQMALKKFKKITPSDISDKFQSLLYLMRLLVNSPGIKSQSSSYLKLNEDFLFMQFQRRIEMGDAVLSAAFFHFLMECSLIMDGWNQRIRNCVIESKFPSLLCQTLLSSKNKREISGALLAMQLLLTDSTTQYIYFENFTSSIFTMNTKAYDTVEETMCELDKEKKHYAVEKKNFDDTSFDLQNKIHNLEEHLAKERKNSSKLEKKMRKVIVELDKTRKDLSTKEIEEKHMQKEKEDLERNVRDLTEDNVKLAKKLAKYKSQLVQLKEVYNENEELKAKLSVSNNRYDVLLNKNALMEAQLEQFKDTLMSQSNEILAKGRKITSLEIKLGEAEKQITQDEENIRSLQHQVDADITEIAELKAQLSLETRKRSTFELSLQHIEAENKSLKQTIDEKTSTTQSQASQIEIMKKTIKQLKKQNKKLVGVANLNTKVHTAQNTTIHNLFGDNSL